MNYFNFFRFSLVALSLSCYPHFGTAAPLTGPTPTNETNAYGVDIYPDNDITNDESTTTEQAKQFEHARMAFLFGQYQLAFAGWEPLANEGYSQAQATLAWMYHTGKGVKKNLRTAHYWYTRAANQSHVIAKNNLGVFYEQGLGVQENLRLAAEMYLDAAQSGYAYAQYNMGMLFHDGRGVKKNKKEAIFWLQIAALQGVTQAQDVLESMGRKVTIPQHVIVNKRIKAKSQKPKWHKQKLQATISPKLIEKTQDVYKKQREKLAAATSNSKSATKKANKPEVKTKKPSENSTAKKSTRTQKLLVKNRALIAKKPHNIRLPVKVATNTPQTRHKSNSSSTAVATKPRIKTAKKASLFAERWVRKQNPKRYTLQVAQTDDLSKLKSLATLLGKEKNTAYFHTRSKGKKSYNLIYGVFASRSAAQKNIKSLPREFKKWSPWIRRFSELHAKIK